VKIPSVVLCLSYKGKGERNIEDVHDFVFRLPMIEYRNKTWSNLDLALALKKDVIRALISHTGAIINNKFSKHRPNASQQNRLRELATSSMLLAPSSNDNSNDGSDASTFNSPTEAKHSDARRSFASSGRPSTASSSAVSLHTNGRAATFPASLTMTPVDKTNADSIADSELGSTKNGSGNEHGNGHDDEKHGFMASTLQKMRRKNSHTPMNGNADSPGDEDSVSTRRKSKLLLGKKIMHSLNS